MVDVRIGAHGDQGIGVVGHRLGDVAVQIQRHDNRDARPDLGTQPAEQFALGVLVALGHHRAVQMQQRAVDALGGGQEHVTDLVEQRVVDIA